MPAQQNFDEDAWDDLLNYIEERRVIPIIGPELLRVQTDRGLRLLYDWLAEKLAARLQVDTSGLPQPLSLNDVVCCYLGQRGRREEAYTRLRVDHARGRVRAAARPAPARADHRFRPVRDHDVRPAARAGDQPRALSAASRPPRSSPMRRTASPTFPSSAASCSAPVVYHLLGRLSASPTYVISDEDMLEFICALQCEHLTPEKLFHELEHNHLLLIGSDFSNWLARLFLRMAKRQRLSDPRDVGEVLADDHTMQDERLVAFLQQVSVRTRVYGGAESFVAELHARWTQAAGGRPAAPRRLERAAALPAARPRDAGQRRLHQLRARGPAGRAAAQGGAGRGRHRHVVRPRPARKRRRLRPQDPARTSRAAASSCPSSPRRPSGATRAISAASGATRSTARATSPRARCSSCRSASTTRPRPRRWCRKNSGRCTSRAPPGGEPGPELLRRLQELLSGRRS